jgi:cyd operon protein YbgE
MLSLALCMPLSVVLLVHPVLLLDAQGGYSHGSLMLVLWGVSIGYVHGMGFDPRAWAWKLALQPILGWGLMILGYALLLPH